MSVILGWAKRDDFAYIKAVDRMLFKRAWNDARIGPKHAGQFANISTEFVVCQYGKDELKSAIRDDVKMRGIYDRCCYLYNHKGKCKDYERVRMFVIGDDRR